ncbi:MAG: hypothetical protein RR504_03215, partial [Christensenellaceae bacterium]
KLLRKNELGGEKGYGLAQFKDNARISILMNSFEDIPKVMERLKAIYPDLDVEFKQEGNGYIGFHVTVQQGGVNAEIQLTTNEMFKVKLASDKVYEKVKINW